jgi:2-polyprenyl-3-methyl-5-hydroxy-6-metoxy-1,4-benzoquinol methylase
VGRIEFAHQCLSTLDGISSLLDVGCRGCELKAYLQPHIAYAGLDLEQNKQGTVTYVGDVMTLPLSQRFDCIVALDVLEHVENPGVLFDRLVALARNHLLISLPNCYDLKGRVKFAFRGNLGGKYTFSAHAPIDRHRWLTGREEIYAFYRDKAAQHGLQHEAIDMLYGSFDSPRFSSRIRALSRLALPRNLCTATVFGVFSRRPMS